MSVRQRVLALERQFSICDGKDGYDDDAPVSVIEWLHGIRDENTRKRLGRQGCVEAANEIRRVSAGIAQTRAAENAKLATTGE